MLGANLHGCQRGCDLGKMVDFSQPAEALKEGDMDDGDTRGLDDMEASQRNCARGSYAIDELCTP